MRGAQVGYSVVGKAALQHALQQRIEEASLLCLGDDWTPINGIGGPSPLAQYVLLP